MQINKPTKQLTEAALFLSIAMVFSWIGFSFMPLLLIVLPLPFIVAGSRIGFKYTVISLLLCFLLITFTIDPLTGLFFIFGFSGMILSIDWGLKKRKKMYQTIILSIFTTLLGLLVYLLMFDKITGLPFKELISQTFDQMFEMNEALFKSAGVSGKEIDGIMAQMKDAVVFVKQIFPSTLILYASFLVYLNYTLSISVLRKMKLTIIKIPAFRNFEIPRELFIGVLSFIAFAMICFFTKKLNYIVILNNVLFLSSILFFVQGLSLLIFIFNKYKVKNFVRVFVIIMSFLYSPLVIMITGVGFLDRLVHFRKIEKLK